MSVWSVLLQISIWTSGMQLGTHSFLRHKVPKALELWLKLLSRDPAYILEKPSLRSILCIISTALISDILTSHISILDSLWCYLIFFSAVEDPEGQKCKLLNMLVCLKSAWNLILQSLASGSYLARQMTGMTSLQKNFLSYLPYTKYTRKGNIYYYVRKD